MSYDKRARYEVLRRDGFACRYCGAKAPSVVLEVDHVIPRVHGGTNERCNLTAACQTCNSQKRDGIPSDELIAEVRLDEVTYQQGRGHRVYPCIYCHRPIQHAADEDTPTECAICNSIACDSYEAGRRAALGLPEMGSPNAMVQG